MRDELLDVLKGLGIILVVFAHVNKGVPSQIVYLFHMPLFFFLAGSAHVYSKKDDMILFVKKTFTFFGGSLFIIFINKLCVLGFFRSKI